MLYIYKTFYILILSLNSFSQFLQWKYVSRNYQLTNCTENIFFPFLLWSAVSMFLFFLFLSFSSSECSPHFHLHFHPQDFPHFHCLQDVLFCSLLRILFKTDRRIRDIVSFLLWWTSNPLINQDITRDNTRPAYITIISDTPQPTLQDQP